MSDYEDKITRLLPEGVTLEKAHYSNQQYIIKGRTTNTDKIQKLLKWCILAGIPKPEVHIGQSAEADEVEFEIPFPLKGNYDLEFLSGRGKCETVK